MRASDWQGEERQLEGWTIQLRSYLINGQYLAEVEVLTSGVTIARATEPERADAERRAIEKAAERLHGTRRHPVDLMVGG